MVLMYSGHTKFDRSEVAAWGKKLLILSGIALVEAIEIGVRQPMDPYLLARHKSNGKNLRRQEHVVGIVAIVRNDNVFCHRINDFSNSL